MRTQIKQLRKDGAVWSGSTVFAIMYVQLTLTEVVTEVFLSISVHPGSSSTFTYKQKMEIPHQFVCLCWGFTA